MNETTHVDIDDHELALILAAIQVTTNAYEQTKEKHGMKALNPTAVKRYAEYQMLFKKLKKL